MNFMLVVKECLDILTLVSGNNSVISKAQQCVGVYSTDTPLLGESKNELSVCEKPHIFWKNLLEGRVPQWRYACCPTPRNRKRVLYFDSSSKKSETKGDDVEKKRCKVVNSGGDPSPIQFEPTSAGTTQAIPVSIGKSSMNQAGTKLLPEANSDKPEEKLISDEQKNLNIFLKGEMEKLCQALALSEDVKQLVGRFLEYVIDNHRVSTKPEHILHALQMSMCWSAASILKQKIDKKEMLNLAKQKFKFECTEDIADFVYLKLRMLKKNFVQQPEIINLVHSLRCSTSEEEE